MEINVDEDRGVFKDFTIHVNFNKHFSYPPYLESLNGNEFYIEGNRGEKHDWIYKLHQEKSIGQNYTFRLELIQ